MARQGDAPLHEEEIARLVDAVGIDGTVASSRVIDDWQGPSVCATMADGTRLRIACFPGATAHAYKEAALTERIRRETDVPVCSIVGVDAQGDVAGVPAIVSHDPGGLPVFDIAGLAPDNQTRLFREFGATLAKLHRGISFDSVGLISAAGDDVVDAEATWRGWYLPRLTAQLGHLEAGPLAGYRDAIERRFDEVRPDLDADFETSLVKHAYAFEQFLVDPDATPLTRAVRGFHRALAAPAEYGYCVARWVICERACRSDSFRDAFDAGFADVLEIPAGPGFDRRRDCYRLERLLRELGHIQQAVEDDRIDESEGDGRRERVRDHLDHILATE